MQWGLTISGPSGPVEITDYEYYQHFGDPLPEEPDLCHYGHRVLGFFHKVHRRRQSAMNLCPLTYTEVRNWSEMTRTLITPEEVELIMATDDAFLSAMSDGMQLKRTREERAAKQKAKR